MAEKRDYTGSGNPNFKGGRTERINFSITKAQKGRLRFLAKEKGVSMSDLIIDALCEYDRHIFPVLGDPVSLDLDPK